jgi:hypothetical protein
MPGVLRAVLMAVIFAAACGNDTALWDPPRHVSLPARVRLLTEAQYANAVRDLLGDVHVPTPGWPGVAPHQLVHEDLLAIDSPLLVQFRLAAESVAAEIAAWPGDGCVDDACARGGVEAFASRAFRRPLEPAEADALWQIYHLGWGFGRERGASEDAARAAGFAHVVEAVLQAPSFVYRTELGGGEAPDARGLVALTAHELAAELSFLLTDSLPDEPLRTAAGDGSLLREEVLAAHVERLLGTPRARAHLADVVLRWLGAYDVLEARKDVSQFPSLTPELRASMLTETRLFVLDVLWERGGSLRELLTSSETFVDERLAAHYEHRGVSGDRHVRVSLRGDRRAGVLTHGSILTSLATEQRESIIKRGIYVHERLLCTPELGRPPFDAIVASARFTHAMSEAQFSYFREAHIYCSTCHRTIDPPGRALHHYDGSGRYRTADTIDVPVDASGALEIGGARREFADAIGLGRALGGSEHVGRCVTDQLAHHALGRLPDPSLRGYLHRRFESAGRDLVEVFRALATSPQFRLRRGAR